MLYGDDVENGAPMEIFDCICYMVFVEWFWTIIDIWKEQFSNTWFYSSSALWDCFVSLSWYYLLLVVLSESRDTDYTN